MSDKNNKTMKPGWHRVKFGDVVRQCKEKADPETSGLERYIAGDHMDTDDLRLRRWGEIGSGYLGPAFHMRFKPGQVLYGSRRTYLRKVAVADFDGICANTTFVLESKAHQELMPDFLPFLMQTEEFNSFSVKHSKGSVNPYINFSDLERFEFDLPPINEQARIVSLLQEIEASAEEIRNLQGESRRLIESIFQENVWGNQSLPRAPINSIADLNPSVAQISEDDPFIPMDALDVWTQQIDISRIEKKGQRGGVRAQGGDILMARITPCLENGKIAQVPVSIKKCGGSTEFIVFRAKDGTDQQFLYHLITSRVFHSQAAGTMSGSTGRQRASANDVGRIIVPILPLTKQIEICDQIKQISKIKEATNSRLLGLSQMKLAVLTGSGSE